MSKKEYIGLVKRVARIDRKAAQYMRRRAKSIGSFCYSDNLCSCFNWKGTAQGHEYWLKIYNEIGE